MVMESFTPLDTRRLSTKWETYYVNAVEPKARELRLRKCLHIIRMPARDLYQIVACDTGVNWLHDHGFNHQQTEDELPLPIEGEIYVYGHMEAHQRAQIQFVEASIQAIRSTSDRSLDDYFRQHLANSQVLTVPIEWAILVRDIIQSNPSVFNRFLLCCDFVTVHLHSYLHRDTFLELVTKNRKTLHAPVVKSPDRWYRHFEQLGQMKARVPERETDENFEMHQVALLRGALDFAGFETIDAQNRVDKEYSANENLRILGQLLGIEVEEEVSLSDMNWPLMQECLQHYASADLDLQELKSRICRFVPIGGEYPYLPLKYVHGLGYT